MLVASSLASDAGIYQCVARNSVGMIWAASRLILNATKPAPKPPEKVSCRTVSSSEIAVDWDISPDHSIGGIKAFSIHYYDIGNVGYFYIPLVMYLKLIYFPYYILHYFI